MGGAILYMIGTLHPSADKTTNNNFKNILICCHNIKDQNILQYHWEEYTIDKAKSQG